MKVRQEGSIDFFSNRKGLPPIAYIYYLYQNTLSVTNISSFW